jgi:hypothetical protein
MVDIHIFIFIFIAYFILDENHQILFLRAQNMKKRPENKTRTRHPRYRSKRDSTSLVPSKMSSETQNKKTGPDALGTAENDSAREKHENGS